MELKITKHENTFYIGRVAVSSFFLTGLDRKSESKKYISFDLIKNIRFSESDTLRKAEARALKLANDFKNLLEKEKI